MTFQEFCQQKTEGTLPSGLKIWYYGQHFIKESPEKMMGHDWFSLELPDAQHRSTSLHELERRLYEFVFNTEIDTGET
jgi:hypothetical protein